MYRQTNIITFYSLILKSGCHGTWDKLCIYHKLIIKSFLLSQPNELNQDGKHTRPPKVWVYRQSDYIFTYCLLHKWRYQNWRNSKVEISIYHALSIYLPPCCRERRPLLIKKVAPFVRTKVFNFSLSQWPHTRASFVKRLKSRHSDHPVDPLFRVDSGFCFLLGACEESPTRLQKFAKHYI